MNKSETDLTIERREKNNFICIPTTTIIRLCKSMIYFPIDFCHNGKNTDEKESP